MSTQPEALRLADALQTGSHHRPVLDRSSAELRRLHEANQELLGALKEVFYGEGKSYRELLQQARAAIAKAEGEAK